MASLAVLLTSSAFADSRHQDQTYRRDAERRGSYRDNDRVSLQGRVTSFSHESSGYRVHLDRGPSFWVPESYVRSRGRDFRVGINISLGGVFRGGSVYVDAVSWPDDGYGYGGNRDGYYRDGFVRGVVDRVDFRRATVWLRDDRSGRLVEVDMRGDRYGRLNLDDLRRGDYVELSGGWVRGDIFAADRIESIRSGRY